MSRLDWTHAWVFWPRRLIDGSSSGFCAVVRRRWNPDGGDCMCDSCAYVFPNGEWEYRLP